MGGEELRMGENVERGPGAGVDFEQGEMVAVNEEIEAGEAAEVGRRDEGEGGGVHVLQSRTRPRAERAAVAVPGEAGRIGPLPACAQHLPGGAVRQHQQRHRHALHPLLKVPPRRGPLPGKQFDVAPARPAGLLDQPIRPRWRRCETGRRVRHAGCGAECSKRHRVFHQRHGRSIVADQRPAPGEFIQQRGPVLEAGSRDHAKRSPTPRQPLQRRQQRPGLEPALEIAFDDARLRRDLARVHVAEEIGDERLAAGGARRRRQRPARQRGDQNVRQARVPA